MGEVLTKSSGHTPHPTPFRFPISLDRFVESVGGGQLPERGEFARLAEADFKHNVFKKTNAVGKTYSSSKKGPMNRFINSKT